MHWKDLDVWQVSHDLTLKIYNVTKTFSKDEQYGLVSQLKRASYSVPVNIVEGFSRKHTKEFIQFLNIANASLEELRYFLLLARDLNLIENKVYDELENQSSKISKMLNGLIKSLRLKMVNKNGKR
ncbi:MAG: four helix bundle protein [Elusimicrobiales bacterium]|jgi:four helix bundle protein|nr:four helix bundle protein [Elusimicrobiales bacterium]